MPWLKQFICILNWVNFIEEHLSICKLPIPVEKHHKWSIVKDIYCLLVHIIVKERWFLIEVCKHHSFRDILIYYSKKGDRKQQRQRDSMQKSSENHVQQHWVSKLHYYLRSRKFVYIILNSFWFWIWLNISIRQPTIKQSTYCFWSKINHKSNLRSKRLNRHSFY